MKISTKTAVNSKTFWIFAISLDFTIYSSLGLGNIRLNIQKRTSLVHFHLLQTHPVCTFKTVSDDRSSSLFHTYSHPPWGTPIVLPTVWSPRRPIPLRVCHLLSLDFSAVRCIDHEVQTTGLVPAHHRSHISDVHVSLVCCPNILSISVRLAYYRRTQHSTELQQVMDKKWDSEMRHLAWHVHPASYIWNSIKS